MSPPPRAPHVELSHSKEGMPPEPALFLPPVPSSHPPRQSVIHFIYKNIMMYFLFKNLYLALVRSMLPFWWNSSSFNDLQSLPGEGSLSDTFYSWTFYSRFIQWLLCTCRSLPPSSHLPSVEPGDHEPILYSAVSLAFFSLGPCENERNSIFAPAEDLRLPIPDKFLGDSEDSVMRRFRHYYHPSLWRNCRWNKCTQSLKGHLTSARLKDELSS